MLVTTSLFGSLLLLLVSFSGTLSQCDTQITIDIQSNGSLVLPLVNTVVLTSSSLTGDNFTWSNSDDIETFRSNYTIDVMMEMNDTYVVTNGTTTYQFALSYEMDAVACQNILFNIEFSSTVEKEKITVECFPVTSCGVSPTFSSLTWKKSFNGSTYINLMNGFNDFSSYTGVASGDNRNEIVLETVEFNGVSVNNARLIINQSDINSVGYYEIYGNETQLIHQFVIFRAPVRMNSPESLIVIKGTDDPYRGIFCLFESFPPAVVSWTRGSNRDIVQQTDRIMLLNIARGNTGSNYTEFNENLVEFTYTITGGIEFDMLQYSDADMYYCTADNGIRTTENHVRLRVRDPLRPLWPSLGIIAVAVVTAVFIGAGTLGEKIKKAKKAGSLEPEEINAAFSNSPYPQKASVTDDETSPNRRVSSTVELLPKS